MQSLDEPLEPGAPAAPGEEPATGTGTLERTQTKPREERAPGDTDRYAHYVRRDRADASLITGQPVVALCGKVWVPTRDASKYPVCPVCKRLRDQMGSQGKFWPFSDGTSGGSGA